MSGKTKIFVLHMKEVIYTCIFLFLGLIFLILLAIMFLPDKHTSPSSAVITQTETDTSFVSPSDLKQYTPGIYTAALEVSGNTMEIQLILEDNVVTDVRFTQLDEAVETMFPLFTPVLENISEQLKSGIPLDEITYEDSQKYTATILLGAIETIMQKAAQ